jgi:hypothetical protein
LDGRSAGSYAVSRWTAARSSTRSFSPGISCTSRGLLPRRGADERTDTPPHGEHQEPLRGAVRGDRIEFQAAASFSLPWSATPELLPRAGNSCADARACGDHHRGVERR